MTRRLTDQGRQTGAGQNEGVSAPLEPERTVISLVFSIGHLIFPSLSSPLDGHPRSTILA